MGEPPSPGEPGGADDVRAWFRLDHLDDAPLGVLCSRIDGTIVDANRAFLTLLARDRADVVGRTWRELTHPDDLPACDELHVVVRQGGQQGATPLRKRYLRADGSAVWTDVSIATIARGGRAVATLAFVQDVTPFVAAEEALRLANERLAAAIDLPSDGLWEWDRGHVTTSRRWHDLTGIPGDSSALDLAAWQAMLHPDDAARVGEVYAELMAGSIDEFAHEYRLRTPRGLLHVLDRGRVVAREDDGRPRRILGSLTDLTALRTAEAALVHARKIEALGRLAGGVAHDVNNLLTVIGGSAALLRRSAATAQLGPIGDIEQAVDSAAQLARNLLAFSRKQVLERRPVPIGQQLARLAGMLRRLIGEDVQLVTKVRGMDPPVEIDPGQAEQVIVNLVINARDAMPSGGTIVITVDDAEVAEPPGGLWPRVRPGPHVVLAVTDTGDGLTDEAKQHLFEPFFTTKEPGRGTGLGLSTVYGVVEQHDGFIEVDSEPGCGTTFRLYFPRAARAAAQAPARALGWVRGDERIVVVEDDPLVREVVGRSLRELGYQVDDFPSGADCLAALDRVRGARLLLTDVVMPGIGGRELATRLAEEVPGLRTLFMSGYVADAEAIAGAPFIAKPFHPSELARKVREALDPA